MVDREVEWIVLVPLSLLIGFIALLLDVAGAWPFAAVRPDFVWCLGFFASRRSPPASAMAASAWCGLAHDLTLGPKLGSATLAYLLVAWIFLLCRDWVAGNGFAELTVLVGFLSFCANLLRLCFDQGSYFFAAWSGNLFIAIAGGLLTLVVYGIMYMLLWTPGFNPTRERKWSV